MSFQQTALHSNQMGNRARKRAACSRHLTPLLLLIALLSPSFISANPLLQDLPAFPAPPNTQSSWIAKDIVVNNTPMSFKEFIYPGSAEQFEAYYKQQWPGPFFNKSYLGDETLLGYFDKSYSYSVRFKERLGRLSGQMVVSKISTQAPQNLRTEFPLPLGSTIKQIIHARDSGRLSETISATNRLSINGNARYMQTELRSLGWVLQKGGQPIDAIIHNKGLQLEFSKYSASIQITLSIQQKLTDQRTQVLIHWIK